MKRNKPACIIQIIIVTLRILCYNCNTGECLGLVLDLEFEIHTGKICYLIVPKTTKMFICVGKNKVYKIPYKCIVRIGGDTILVDINEKECLK